MKPIQKSLDDDALRDLVSDAEQSEHQAEHGPFFPEKGVTRDMCLAYAARCRKAIDRYKNGGAHAAVLAGKY